MKLILWITSQKQKLQKIKVKNLLKKIYSTLFLHPPTPIVPKKVVTIFSVSVFACLLFFLTIWINPVVSLGADTPEKKALEENNDTGLEKYVCEKNIISVSVSNPKLELLRLTDLCADSPGNKGFFDEKIVAENNENLAKIEEILKGTPMEKMASEIAGKDKVVAGFIVGIALKESGLGFHAPYKNNRDCFNYWGYKGNTDPTTGGYSCFASPEEAIKIVGKRIEDLVQKNLDTPQKMIVWKCGNSCQGHSSTDVAKWISDVSIYFNKINS
jgi:hypothetical protein